jgi:glycerophosphoryl diester phosphodiesterase
MFTRLALATTAVLVLQAFVAVPSAAHPDPLVIGHRGAAGYRPEHTAVSYELAARMGADYIEPDLVSTKDGVLVARHENEIGGSTDVASHPEFASRRTTKTVDGWEMTGWFTEDFTLAELKTLRARESQPELRPENTKWDGKYQIMTFQEVIDLSRRLSRQLGREIGIYPETKHPAYFAALGLPVEPGLVRTLNANGLNHRRAKVFVQSFEDNLKSLRRQLRVPLVRLVWDPAQVTPDELRDIARYADAVGAHVSMIIAWNEDGTLGASTSLVRDAHRAGLAVHAYTFAADDLPTGLSYRQLLKTYYRQGIDGAFADHPDGAVAARR